MNLSSEFENHIKLRLGASATLNRLFMLIFGGGMAISLWLKLGWLNTVVLIMVMAYMWYRTVGLHVLRNHEDAVECIELSRTGHTKIHQLGKEQPVLGRLLSQFLHPNLVILRLRRLDTNGLLTVMIPRDAVNDHDQFGFLRSRLALTADPA